MCPVDIMERKFKVTFNSPDLDYIKEFDGTFLDNRIIYTDDGIETIVDIDKKVITRSSGEYTIELDFSNNIHKVFIKESDLYLPLNIILDVFIVDNNFVKIAYHNEDEKENKVEYLIEYINNL